MLKINWLQKANRFIFLVHEVTLDVPAVRVDGQPIFATQFHPELSSDANRLRYIRYCERYPPTNTDEYHAILESMIDTPEATQMMSRWLLEVLEDTEPT